MLFHANLEMCCVRAVVELVFREPFLQQPFLKLI